MSLDSVSNFIRYIGFTSRTVLWRALEHLFGTLTSDYLSEKINNVGELEYEVLETIDASSCEDMFFLGLTAEGALLDYYRDEIINKQFPTQEGIERTAAAKAR
jgi:hypothetical protein